MVVQLTLAPGQARLLFPVQDKAMNFCVHRSNSFIILFISHHTTFFPDEGVLKYPPSKNVCTANVGTRPRKVVVSGPR
jgi:hypothetical protein